MTMTAEEITVAAYGEIAVAPLGTPLPVDVDEELDDAFAELGYVTEDGVTFTATPTTEDINAWQSATPVRRLVTARELTLATSFQQWNRDTFATAFGGGQWTSPSAGVYRYDPPADTAALAEQAVVITSRDGEKHYRWVVMRTNVTEAVETNLVRTGAAVLPVTFNALAPEDEDRSWYFLSDVPGFAPAIGGGGPAPAPSPSPPKPASAPAPVPASAAKGKDGDSGE